MNTVETFTSKQETPMADAFTTGPRNVGIPANQLRKGDLVQHLPGCKLVHGMPYVVATLETATRSSRLRVGFTNGAYAYVDGHVVANVQLKR